MPGLSDNFWGRPSGHEHGRPGCRCGGALGTPGIVPADATAHLPEVGFRRCTSCREVVFIAVTEEIRAACREIPAC